MIITSTGQKIELLKQVSHFYYILHISFQNCNVSLEEFLPQKIMHNLHRWLFMEKFAQLVIYKSVIFKIVFKNS